MAASIWYHRDGIDFDHPFRSGESRDYQPGRDREDTFQVLAHGSVYGLPVAWVGDVDGHLADVLEATARFLHEHGDVLHRPLGLGRRVADADALTRVEVLAHLSAQK